jgi:hypothetical protein
MPKDHSRLGEVMRAKEKIGLKAKKRRAGPALSANLQLG